MARELAETDVDGRILLKFVLQKWNVTMLALDRMQYEEQR
jgi:hypothetical protein